MHENHAVVIIGGAVIRLALADPDEGAVDIVIGDVIVLPQVTVLERMLPEAQPWQLSQPLMTVLLGLGMILYHGSVRDRALIRTVQLQSAGKDHPS